MSEGPAARPRRVPCPTCRRDALYDPSNPWRPFCSERCRGVDLGAWATESYRVPAEAPPDADGPGGDSLPRH